jgi:glycosyltransferase involved in cell wall biosynthesis
MVTVARITHRKGHHLALAALARLPERLRQRITWLVIGPNGEADYVNELQRLIEAANCDVRLLGPLPNEEIRDIYGAADLFCLTGLPDSSGRVEGFGLVYLEAGASGVPSVATAVGGVPDAVLPDQSGILVPPDIDSISAAITRFAENDELRATLAAGALAHARALSWERCAAATYGLSRNERPAPQAEVVTA